MQVFVYLFVTYYYVHNYLCFSSQYRHHCFEFSIRFFVTVSRSQNCFVCVRCWYFSETILVWRNKNTKDRHLFVHLLSLGYFLVCEISGSAILRRVVSKKLTDISQVLTASIIRTAISQEAVIFTFLSVHTRCQTANHLSVTD